MRTPNRTVSALFLLSSCLFAFTAASAENLVPLPGHVTGHMRAAAAAQRAPADEVVELSLVVRVDQDLLGRTLAEKRVLSPAEFASTFGLAEKRQKLKDFASAAGLSLDPADDQPGSLLVKVKGPASVVEKAFNLQLNHYQGADGQTFRGHDTEPMVPETLVPQILAVIGLSNERGVRKPHVAFRQSPAVRAAAVGNSASPAMISGGHGLGGGLSPADIKTIYGLNSVTLNGTGQIAAILEFDGYAPADISLYKTQYGLASTPVTFTSVGGQANLCGTSQNLTCNAATLAADQAGMVEVALDIELMIALAPNLSNVLVYTAVNTNPGNLAALNQMATDNTAKVISISWGGDENASGAALMVSESAIFAQMTLQGQTIFAAAGDNGAYDGGGTTTLLVDDPASQPNVISVGGTSLSGSVSAPTEVVWNNGIISGHYVAGGGGIANYVSGSTTAWPLPSYQSGVAGTFSQTFRNVPDVSLDADPNSAPYSICVGGSCNSCGSPCTTLTGGTSAAAPLWAALAALVNQQRAANSIGTLGFAHSFIYQIGTGANYGADFNDITSGNNGFYTAGAGYDNASGWGSFKGAALINDLAAQTVSIPAATGIAGQSLGVSSVKWTWNAVANADTYRVYTATASNTNVTSAGTLIVSPPSFTWNNLFSNATVQIIIKGYNNAAAVEGAASLSPKLSTLADPATLVTASAFISSITVSFKASGNSSGFRVDAAQAADFSGVLVSSSGASPGAGNSTTLSAIGLAPSTLYYLRVAALNPLGGGNFTTAGNSPQATSGNLVPPATASFPFNSTDTIRLSWTDPNNGPGLTYQAHASLTNTFVSSTTISTTSFSADFRGLLVNTSYYFRVEVVNAPTLNAGPLSTLTLPPVSVAASTFTGVGANGLTVNWLGTGNPPGTAFKVDVATNSNFTFPVTSSVTLNAFGTLAGLLTNATYFARVASLNQAGLSSSYLILPATSTLAAPPLASAAFVTNLNTAGFSLYFYGQADPPGTPFLVQFSTLSNFAVIASTASGLIQSGFSNPADTAAVAGLIGNQAYFFRVAAINNNGIPAYTAGFSTGTLPALPVARSTSALAATASTLRPSWGPGPNAAQTSFTASVSSDPAFGSAVQSSTTGNAFASFFALWANTTYYLSVQAKSAVPPNPDSAFAFLGAGGVTLSNPPGVPAQPFVSVTYASVTAQWLPLPPAPSSATGTGYVLQASTDPNFAGTIFSNAYPGVGVAQGAVTGLAFATTYYLRVGSLNWAGAPDFAALGSTRTLVPQISSAAVPGGAAFSLAVVPPYPQIQSIQVNIPASAFPDGTSVVLNSNVELELPPPVSNEAQISFLGPTVGFSITAAGYQPNYPVAISLQYNLPAGVDPNRLVLARYDADSAQWVLLPSKVNADARTLTGVSNHFSFFTPALVQPGAGLDSVNIFPLPWEPGSDNGLLNSPTLNFTNLPGGATLRIFNITGELVWKADVPASGTWAWTGENNNGNWAGSGTYLVVIDSGGRRKVRRIVIVR